MTAAQEAYEVVKQLPGLTEPDRQYLVTVARGEGFFGRGWATPSKATIEVSKRFGLTGFEGTGSRNWGAEQGSGDAGSFPHIDYGWRTPDGKPWKGTGPKVWGPYVGQYAKYTTDLTSAARFARILLKSNVREALQRGSLRDAVMAQHSNGYFELNPEKYLSAVLGNYGRNTSEIGWTPLLSELGNGGGSPNADPLVPFPDGPPESGPPSWLLAYMQSEDMR